MKKYFAILLLVLFSFCSKKRESTLPRIAVPKVKHSIQVNTKEMLKINFVNTIVSNFDHDTIINENLVFNKSNLQDYVTFKDRDTLLSRYNFSVFIDTSYTIPRRMFVYKNIEFPDVKNIVEEGLINGKEPTDKQIKLSEKIFNEYSTKTYNQSNDYVNCYPLLIYNSENKICFFNIIDGMKFIQEAKDKDGKWKPIEFFVESPSCDSHNDFYKFHPKKYIANPIIKYNGDFKTKLRVKVKIGKYYYFSNEFTGYINRSQFNLDYLHNYLKFYKKSWDDKMLYEYSNDVLLR